MRASRRQLLGAIAGALAGGASLAPRPASAAPAPGASDLRLAQLRMGGNWNPRPDTLRRLAWEVGQRTSIEVELEVAAIEPESKQLFRHPFLYWAGSGAAPELSAEAQRLLRRHITYGGTLLVDSAEAEPGGPFDTSVRRTLAQLFPRQSLERLPNDHVLYKTFYLVDQTAGRVIRAPYLEALMLEKRVAVVYSQNDLGGAWARDAFGRWEHQVSPGGDRQREMAYRLGVNVVMYALCLDYKEDLVHAPFILKRRR
jgi:hypothetical protein